MDEIEFVHIHEVSNAKIIDLMNNELVGRQLPLLAEEFTIESCQEFMDAKKKNWNEYGYGPWAFLINGRFAGWGGLQPENGEADFSLILHPNYWGWGYKIFCKVKKYAFNQMNLKAITVLLPPSRSNSKAITRLGFIEDGQLTVNCQLFTRFRLNKSEA